MPTNYTYEGVNNTIQRLVVVSPSWLSTGRIQIPLYTTILLLALTGNALVILTLAQNRRMRTITNVFLLNLAVSDILLGVLCMPFTLIGELLRDFVFGEIMCKFLPYLQASSVAVSAWTLVAISCERYYAICHPLSSRRWQTLKHAYKLIGLIWFGSFLFMSPIAVLSRLIPTSQGHHKCREYWPEGAEEYEKTFNLYLDVILLVIPLIMLGATYSLITKTLWQGMRDEKSAKHDTSYDTTQSSNNLVEVYLNAHGTHTHMVQSSRCPSTCHHQSRDNIIAWHQLKSNYSQESQTTTAGSAKKHSPGHHKCREYWPEGAEEYEKTFNLYLDVILLVIPLIMLGATYSLITKTLWQGMRDEKSAKHDTSYDTTQSSNNLVEVYLNAHGTHTHMVQSSRCPSTFHHQSRDNIIAWHQLKSNYSQESQTTTAGSAKKHSPGLRRTNAEKSLQNKKRIIQMLFVVVLEFFICWTPLYVINTIALFNPQLVYNKLGYTSISICQLLAYSSSCCNPITYCFMNRGFRKAFLNLFGCFKKFNEPRRMSIGYAGTQISDADVNRLQQPSTRQFNQPSESVNPANNELQLYNIMNNLNNVSPINSYKQQTFTDNNNQ